MLVTPLDVTLQLDCNDLLEATLRLGDDEADDWEGRQLSFIWSLVGSIIFDLWPSKGEDSEELDDDWSGDAERQDMCSDMPAEDDITAESSLSDGSNTTESNL